MKTETIFTEDYVLLNNLSFMIGIKTLAYKKLNPEAIDLGLPLLPDWDEEIDVEKLALKHYHIDSTDTLELPPFELTKENVLGFIEGFNKAQELNKDKQFTLEDIEKAIELARGLNSWWEIEFKHSNKEIIQQLKFPKSFEPEFEYQTREGDWKSVLLPSEWFGSDEGDNPKRIKVVDNVVQGTWKF